MTTALIEQRPATHANHSVYTTTVSALENELREKIGQDALVGVPNLELFIERTEQFLATTYLEGADEVTSPAPAGLRHLFREITQINKRARRRHIHALTFGEWLVEQASWTAAQHHAEQQLCSRRYLAIAVLPCRYCAGPSVTSANAMPAREVISEYGEPVYRLSCGHNTFNEVKPKL